MCRLPERVRRFLWPHEDHEPQPVPNEIRRASHELANSTMKLEQLSRQICRDASRLRQLVEGMQGEWNGG